MRDQGRKRHYEGEEVRGERGKKGAQTFRRGRALEFYRQLTTKRETLKNQLEATETKGSYDVHVNVNGGGFTGQAGAIRHGIARALLNVDPDFRPALKAAGLLTRDARMKKRKKPGLRGARRAPQFSKR